eukprot:3680837-Pyramimonas_sp.AAC.1
MSTTRSDTRRGSGRHWVVVVLVVVVVAAAVVVCVVVAAVVPVGRVLPIPRRTWVALEARLRAGLGAARR